MKNNIIQSEMDVKGSKINVVRVGGYEYISLTDLARTQNDEAPADVVKNWLRNKETISFLGVWEELNNENFEQFINENNIDLRINFLINSKMLSSQDNPISARIFDNTLIQYNYDYSVGIFSKEKITSYQLHDVNRNFASGVIGGKDYIGMSSNSAISYDLGSLKPGEEREFTLFIYMKENKGTKIEENIENSIDKIRKFEVDKKIDSIKKYWRKFVKEHINLDTSNFSEKLDLIYKRSILLFPLLINSETGGIIAAPEIDEERKVSGGYAYCWPRDAVFITKALDILGMCNEAKDFYIKFCKNTQSKNGMWEQRFYTNGNLAPCWGYQIDETASVIYGVYDHYKHTKDNKFLEENLKMCEKATEFLFAYTENLLNIDEEDLVKKELQEKYKKYFEITKHVSYDLWEMNEGVHLYSLSSIISGLECMKKIYETIDNKQENLRLKQEKRNKIALKLNKYIQLLKDYIEDNLIDKNTKTLKRNLKDNNMDISVIGAVYPFNVFNPNEKVIKNTVDKINMTLRTHTSGYLRFEYDNYMGGNNPWIITTLWMALYYIKINDLDNAKKCFSFVVNTSLRHGFLAEQVNNDDKNFKWVIGLGWSHAMFIIVLNELLKANEEKNN